MSNPNNNQSGQSTAPSAGATGPVQDVCKWIETELIAGMVLLPKTEADRVWNDAHERAIGILRNYKRGKGLFQITAPNTKLSGGAAGKETT